MVEKKMETLMKAIFFIVVAIALFLIAVIVSGGTYNIISATCFIIGVILFFVGLIIGVFSLK